MPRNSCASGFTTGRHGCPGYRRKEGGHGLATTALCQDCFAVESKPETVRWSRSTCVCIFDHTLTSARQRASLVGGGQGFCSWRRRLTSAACSFDGLGALYWRSCARHSQGAKARGRRLCSVMSSPTGLALVLLLLQPQSPPRLPGTSVRTHRQLHPR